ncbi:Rap1a/Tai family immunity protein [Massilia jejuensis]|uniref:Rap1a/Tai family immunity protein n=1 Tax=Massilia jejuensis TaxID=648894 RepID=A0ABW0PAN0_9BURK
MRALQILAISAGLAASVLTQAAFSAPTLSGDRFVNMMIRPEPLSSYDYMQREKAYSYLDGARDSAEGRTWCDVDQLKTPDLAYELADQIAKLPPAERKKNASALILRLLGQAFPCQPAKGARP